MTKKTLAPHKTKKRAKIAHPGMMGDGTEEQNLGERGNPTARIKKIEVTAAFGKRPKKIAFVPISRPLFELIRSGNRGYQELFLIVLVVRRLGGNADNPASVLATPRAATGVRNANPSVWKKNQASLDDRHQTPDQKIYV
jgi:hypothetical protein